MMRGRVMRQNASGVARKRNASVAKAELSRCHRAGRQDRDIALTRVAEDRSSCRSGQFNTERDIAAISGGLLLERREVESGCEDALTDDRTR
jgi:hypothetical protein